MHRRILRHRRVEDVEYWRQRAGWFDDDATMKEYNNGVYDKYFHGDGDGSGGGGGGKGVFSSAKGSAIAANIAKILVIGLCAIMLIYMLRVFCNRMGGSGKKEKKRSSSSTRSRSKSRSRSRSRSRKRSSSDYKIMDDERSRRSSRSKSRSRRSRSRSRARSKSGSRHEREKSEQVNPVLV